MKTLTRKDILEALKGVAIDAQCVRVKVLDYANNPLAPEKVAYSITYKEFGVSRKVVYYPNTVGFQFVR